jgi:putative ABC transport system permease protein
MLIEGEPLAKVTLGITLAMAVFLALQIGLSDAGKQPSMREIAVQLGYAAVMVRVCLLACIIPARRALRVEPTEALRAE